MVVGSIFMRHVSQLVQCHAGGQQAGQQPGANSHQPPYNQDVNKGKRFQEHKAQSAKKATGAEASPKSTASSAPGASTPPSSSFVDPPKQAASFRDVVSVISPA